MIQPGTPIKISGCERFIRIDAISISYVNFLMFGNILREVKMNKAIMTVKEASDYCMVSPETIRRWIRNNDLVAYNTHGRGVMKIRFEDLRKFVEEHNILTVDDEPAPTPSEQDPLPKEM